jgi:xylulose-5-phosphate/fructose-6-phosphate phosphoketolase
VRVAGSRSPGATSLIAWCLIQLERHAAHVVEQLEDLPEIRDWTWGAPLPSI